MKQYDLAPTRKAPPYVTQAEVAREYGCHEKALIDIEKGSIEITPSSYDALHAAIERCKARKTSKCEKARDLAVT